MENKYYFIAYKFVEKPKLLDPNRPRLAGETCECIDIHPFDFLEKKVGE